MARTLSSVEESVLEETDIMGGISATVRIDWAVSEEDPLRRWLAASVYA